ncbi:bifunctional 2',3'-cyclic-nucleotide 2'-phosphodiesterase/3'-nucleotidase, partial [Dokdonella sp.]|uniref:bifunctional 2',3'-cyclic-nucleotide 2'-phosphodiesterase/3'-nucleotidase n=1 Tax=Dokdonella sp. TaxID=2291710 RepID=UPI003C41D73D
YWHTQSKLVSKAENQPRSLLTPVDTWPIDRMQKMRNGNRCGDVMDVRWLIAALIAVPVLATLGCAPSPSRHALADDGAHATLAILESTDLHSSILSYDYYRLAEDESLGFERMATLVHEARNAYPNTLLFDAGDTIQGSAIADWQAHGKPISCEQKLAMYKAMDTLGYDGGTIGNHEFNFGLPFLAQVTNQEMTVAGVSGLPCEGPDFPLVLANVLGSDDGQPIFPPTALLRRTLKATTPTGESVEVPIKVGIIGFAPPPIMLWDKKHLEGRVTTLGVVEAARRYAPGLRAEGADIIVAISHGGIDPRAYSETMENANWHLAMEPDIDVLLLGHSHQAFPDPGNKDSRFSQLPEVDNVRGFIHGKPAVMGNLWGKSLGVIELALDWRDGHWRIDPERTHSEVRNIRDATGKTVASDPDIRQAVATEHEATIAYVSQPIGSSNFPMTTYFAVVGDVCAIQPVNTAQREYVRRYVDEFMPDLKDVPVIAAMAPFKVGFAGPNDFTVINAGPLAIRNAADLYLYSNTVAAITLDGAGVKAWLEHSAGYFNQIDPMRTEAQALVGKKVPSYNFDVIQGGISYAIDLGRPAGERIVDLRYLGQPIKPDQPFILATNSYRASGGGGFPGTGGENILFNAPDMSRSILVEWVEQRGTLDFADDGADRAWRFVPMQTAGPVEFQSASNKMDLARKLGLHGITETSATGDGMSTYTIDLSVPR